MVYLLWFGLSLVTFSLGVLEAMSSGLDAQTFLGMPALSLITIGAATIALMFRLPRWSAIRPVSDHPGGTDRSKETSPVTNAADAHQGPRVVRLLTS